MLKVMILILAVCTDCFAASIGLGSANIKIPVKSAVIISTTGTLFLTLSVAFSDIIKTVVPTEICSTISFLLLIALGLFNIFQNTVKKAIKPKNTQNPVSLYFDETAADADNSKTISSKEALLLSVALSADSVITGIGAGLTQMSIPLLTILTFVTGLILILTGSYIGKKIVSTKKIQLGWICGIMLIILAILK